MRAANRLSSIVRLYGSLTKPGIIIGNAITTAAGVVLAAKGDLNLWLLAATLCGISLIIASACICNNIIDREADEKMARTRSRSLARGEIAPWRAFFFATFLGLMGVFCLFLFTNLLALSVALAGFSVYVMGYSFWKYHSMHATLLGSIAGSVPPVVGYCAVSNQLDAGACILFAIIALWQMPHFYAIAIYRGAEYAAASIPVLPLKKGARATKIQMFLYILAFTGASSLLAFLHYVTYSYLIIVIPLSLAWLYLCITGFMGDDDQVWARKMFLFSLVIVVGLCLTIPFTVTN